MATLHPTLERELWRGIYDELYTAALDTGLTPGEAETRADDQLLAWTGAIMADGVWFGPSW